MDGDVQVLSNEPSIQQRLLAMLDQRAVTQADVSRGIGLSGSVVSQYLKGKYPGDVSSLERRLKEYLRSLESSERKALPEAPSYIKTPSGERVISALRHAQLIGTISVVYGGAGLGKTCAIEQYRANGLNVWVSTMTPAHKGVVSALEAVAESMNLHAIGGAKRIFDAIVKRGMKSQGLIVIDEAQHLSTEALDQLRSIPDATGVGMALVGNETIYSRMSNDKRAAYLDRLHSRVGRRVALKAASRDDIDAVITAWGVVDGGAKRLLVQMAQRAGALRILSVALRLASMFAREADGVVTESHVHAAIAEINGSDQ